ncbi:MAG: hypothetical protein HGB12_01505 [Bacteroidetes bacterium]|nr:hypothetical protein [Bacteroidota bacterium]
MKTSINFSTAWMLLMLTFSNISVQSQNEEPQSSQIVKIKTMKIVNGDTIVSEKTYTGTGNMNIEDTLSGNGFENFQFQNFNNFYDNDFLKNFPKIDNYFNDFNFGANDMFFRNFGFPDFQRGFDIDSMIKEFNFKGIDSIFPSLGNNKIIIN